MSSESIYDGREPALTIGAFNKLRESGFNEAQQRTQELSQRLPNHLSLVVEVIEEPNWQEKANCKGEQTEKFYPKNGVGVVEAIKFCSECAVKQECLEYALTNEENFGIWGGKSERERRKIIRQKNQ